MSEEKHVVELIPGYALDCLDQEEMVLVSEHLAVCDACRAEFRSYQAVADQLALAAPDAAPPVDLRQQLMDRVQPSPSPARAEPRPSLWEQLAALFQRAAPAWGVISLVLIILLGVGNLMLRQQLNEAETTTGGMRIIGLLGTDVAPGASGTLVISADGEYGTLVVDGLSPLDEAHQYQLWLIKDGQRTDGGVFSVNSEGYGTLWIDSPVPLAVYESFGVTIEPAGGSPGPTGDRVLGGSL